MALSRERIADELLKLLAVASPSATVKIMLRRGILKPVLPEVVEKRVDDLRAVITAEAQAGIAPDPVRRLAALLPRDSAVAEDVAARLRLSNKARKRLACATGEVDGGPPQALAYRLGIDCAVDRLLLAGRSSDAATIAEWHAPRLPISGGALIKRGLPEGPIVARTLKAIEDRWVASGFATGPEFERIVEDALNSAS
jgi:poly(A) polymerase